VARAHPHQVDRQPLPDVDGAGELVGGCVGSTVDRVRRNGSRPEVVGLEPLADGRRRLSVVLDETFGDLVVSTLVATKVDSP
jgi:hypothetical protein